VEHQGKKGKEPEKKKKWRFGRGLTSEHGERGCGRQARAPPRVAVVVLLLFGSSS
jgi:hypothetical protein